MAKFLHIGFNFGTRPTKSAPLKEIFDTAIDWYRYAPNCWVIYTSRSVDKWYELLKPKIHKDDAMFICELTIENRQGWMEDDFWKWILKRLSKKK